MSVHDAILFSLFMLVLFGGVIGVMWIWHQEEDHPTDWRDNDVEN